MRHTLLFICLLLSGAVTVSAQEKKQITLEDIWRDNTFRIKSVPGFNAMNDGKHYTQVDMENGHLLINIYNLADGKKVRTIFDNSINKLNGNTINVDDYAFSSDEKKLLLLTASQNI